MSTLMHNMMPKPRWCALGSLSHLLGVITFTMDFIYMHTHIHKHDLYIPLYVRFEHAVHKNVPALTHVRLEKHCLCSIFK